MFHTQLMFPLTNVGDGRLQYLIVSESVYRSSTESGAWNGGNHATASRVVSYPKANSVTAEFPSNYQAIEGAAGTARRRNSGHIWSVEK